jgi:hypothetical protein
MHPPRRIGRSIAAVLAGMFVGIILTIGTDIVLHVIGVFPPWGASMVGFDGALLLPTAYRTVYGAAASYLVARLAPDRPMQHALVGGVVGLAVSILGAAVTWNKGPAFGPPGIHSHSSCSPYHKPGRAANSTKRNCAHAQRNKDSGCSRPACSQTGDTYGPDERRVDRFP